MCFLALFLEFVLLLEAQEKCWLELMLGAYTNLATNLKGDIFIFFIIEHF